MKHLEPRQEVGGWQVQVSLLALAASHFARELAKLLTAKTEKPQAELGPAWRPKREQKMGCNSAGRVQEGWGWEEEDVI